jgi:hypothetical protein
MVEDGAVPDESRRLSIRIPASRIAGMSDAIDQIGGLVCGLAGLINVAVVIWLIVRFINRRQSPRE